MDLSFGQLINNCEERLRAHLMQLENSYEPCDLDTANVYMDLADNYTDLLIQR